MRTANAPTRAVLSMWAPTRTMQELFMQGYAAYAPWCRAIDEPGLAVFAVDVHTASPAGCLRVRAGIEHRTAIVGRHDRCDLVLYDYGRSALRQLAIIVDPVRSWERGAGVRYRVLDLHTRCGFTDEEQRPIRGLCAEGPALLWCAGYALFLLPLGDPTDWPEAAHDGWAILPERIYFDEVSTIPRRNPNGLDRSLVLRTIGPRDTSMPLVGDAEDFAGGIELACAGNALAIGATALRDGVLLGRYPRCDGALLRDPSVSRVHLLLVQIDDTLLAIDTATTYGTRRSGCPKARTIVLDRDTELVVGTRTALRWRRFA